MAKSSGVVNKLNHDAAPEQKPQKLREIYANHLSKHGHDFISVAILVAALFALLTLSVWFAAYAWTHLGGDPVPIYGYVALAGGAVISLAVGAGLMALVFYSSRHGYDDLSGGDN
jgi:hypothetical protein